MSDFGNADTVDAGEHMSAPGAGRRAVTLMFREDEARALRWLALDGLDEVRTQHNVKAEGSDLEARLRSIKSACTFQCTEEELPTIARLVEIGHGRNMFIIDDSMRASEMRTSVASLKSVLQETARALSQASSASAPPFEDNLPQAD